jgi:hypothetical protein
MMRISKKYTIPKGSFFMLLVCAHAITYLVTGVAPASEFLDDLARLGLGSHSR